MHYGVLTVTNRPDLFPLLNYDFDKHPDLVELIAHQIHSFVVTPNGDIWFAEEFFHEHDIKNFYTNKNTIKVKK